MREDGVPTPQSPEGGKYLRDLGLNGFSMMARLVSGVVLLVLMARFMGPAYFGEFMYAMTVATIAALPAGLGFAPQLLREISTHPSDAHETLRRITRAKVLMAILVLCGGIAFVVSAPSRHALFGILLLVSLSDSFTDYLLGVLRAKDQFAVEAKLILASSVVHCVFVLAVLVWTVEPVLIALAFLATRSTLLAVVVRTARRLVGKISLSGRFAEILTELRRSLAYSIDSSLILLASQVDTVLLKAVSTTTDVGIYQAGMRLVIGFQNFTGVAANVFIPKLARTFGRGHEYRTTVIATIRTFVTMGLVSGLTILWLGPIFVRNVYGSEYLELVELMPYLALLIFVRFCGGAFGVQLTATGKQRLRTIANASALIAMIAMIGLLASKYSLRGVVLSLIASATLVLLMYWRFARKDSQT